MPDCIPGTVDCEKLRALCEEIVHDPYYQKPDARKTKPAASEPPAACLRCRNCVDVCPNRANFPLPEIKAAVHIDSYCNECGNCACLCPFGYVPYRDKFTWFETAEDFDASANDGFLGREKIRVNGVTLTDFHAVPAPLQQVIDAFLAKKAGESV